ncbi:hypothetical protein FRC01_006660 [Tulasnella sp. 417]|nr:hypothetical protein FRC01_006660 [Tulasnella sp. 417]
MERTNAAMSGSYSGRFHHPPKLHPQRLKTPQWRPFTHPEPTLYRNHPGTTSEAQEDGIILETDAAGHVHLVETTTPAAKLQENEIPTDAGTVIALQTAIRTLGMIVDGAHPGLPMVEVASVGPVHLTMPTAHLPPTCTGPVVVKEMVQGEEIEAIGAAGPQVLVEETGSISKRRQQREASTLSIWPPSPKASSRKLSPPRHKSSSKKSKRSRSATPSDDSEDDSEDDGRRRKHKKHSRSHRRGDRHSERKSSSRKHSRRHRSADSESESDSEDERSRRRSDKGKGKEREDVRSKPEARVEKPAAEEEEEEQWIEAGAATSREESAVADATRAAAEMEINEDEDIGPAPLPKMSDRIDERDYGGALLRGEGSAMAAYVQDGLRIPRRGEIGLKPDEIEAFESVGYVMSGSRHRRMNAVRMRKENQVISAEEKRGILKMQKEEKMKREGLIVGGFKEMLEEKLKTKGSR